MGGIFARGVVDQIASLTLSSFPGSATARRGLRRHGPGRGGFRQSLCPLGPSAAAYRRAPHLLKEI
jgi:hypothetical protein